MNSFGRRFRLTTFGESHGPAIGGVLDGCPPGLHLDEMWIASRLARRRGGRTIGSTARSEADRVHFLSGLLEGVTTGTPIAFVLDNGDIRSSDYSALEQIYRPSHADYTYEKRYGIRDIRGGGRSSARETAARVVAGAIAEQLLRERCGIEIVSYTSRLGEVAIPGENYIDQVTAEKVEQSRYGCPVPEIDLEMGKVIEATEAVGDSRGGIVTTIVRGVPPGWGDPLYDKLSASLAAAMMSINAARGFEIGDGFGLARVSGSEANDPFVTDKAGHIRTETNHSGGIQGGISNGEVIRFRTAFKPISSISLPQRTIDRNGHPEVITIPGRHDRSVFPRVLPIVDAMTALVLADEYLLRHGYTPD